MLLIASISHTETKTPRPTPESEGLRQFWELPTAKQKRNLSRKLAEILQRLGVKS